MAVAALGALLDIEDPSNSSIRPLPAVVARDPRNTKGSIEYELSRFEWGARLTGPEGSGDSVQPATPARISPSTATERQPSIDIAQAWDRPVINKWRFTAACAFSFANGLNDGAAGALIPYMEQHYKINYAIVSLIFITQAAGFLLAAPLIHPLDERLGRSSSYMVAAGSNIICYIVVICQPPWSAVVAMYFFNGFGIALNLALNNVWCANLVGNTTLLGILHGCYGVGAAVAPLMATGMASHGVRWSFYFLIPLVVQIICLVSSALAFRQYEQDSTKPLLNEESQGSQTAITGRAKKSTLLKETLKDKVTLLGSLFIFSYQGAEVSISGWIITFLIKYRGGDPSRVGFVTFGFWAGITLGRFVLSPMAHRVGEKLSVIILTAGAILFQLMVWLLPHVIGDAVAVSVVGLLLGPVYPCAMVTFSRLLVPERQMNALGAISAMGSSGGAVAPFMTGLLSQKFGTFVLHPIAIGLFGVMELAWLCLPRTQKRSE